MINELLKYSKEIGFSDFEIVKSSTSSLSLERRDGKIVKNEISNESSFSFKGLINGKALYADSEEDTLDALKKVLDTMLENSKLITINEPELLYPGDKKYPSVPVRNFDFSKIEIGKKIALLEKMEEEGLKTPNLMKLVGCYYQESKEKSVMANTLGLNLAEESSYAYLYPYMVLKKDDDIAEGYEVSFSYDFKGLNPIKSIKKCSDVVNKKLGAIKDIKSGSYPCAFDKKTMAILLSAFSNHFKASSRYANKTKLVNKLDKKIASDLISIKDDPLSKAAIINSAFDNEGVATKSKVIVDKGVFRMFLNNLKTSKIYNEAPTGNGSGCQPKNFYIENGKTKFSDAIKDIKYGFVIENISGLHAGINNISGDFSLQASGKIIENGKITNAVKMIVVSGNFFKLLEEPKFVCNDLEFLPDLMNFASPTIVFDNIVIAGSK